MFRWWRRRTRPRRCVVCDVEVGDGCVVMGFPCCIDGHPSLDVPTYYRRMYRSRRGGWSTCQDLVAMAPDYPWGNRIKEEA